MSAPALAAPAGRALTIRGRPYPVLLPKLSDPRLHLAAVIISLQVLGQVAFDFHLSIAQILIAIRHDDLRGVQRDVLRGLPGVRDLECPSQRLRHVRRVDVETEQAHPLSRGRRRHVRVNPPLIIASRPDQASRIQPRWYGRQVVLISSPSPSPRKRVPASDIALLPYR